MEADGRDLVVVGGGSGFIGRKLGAALAGRFRVAGISRGSHPPGPPFSEWRRADLFNLREATAALAGARVAVYLVHSMMPSARLTQGSFSDLDLICADNFARAAEQAGVEQIVYLGGLIPEGKDLSQHLASRLEVERTLGRYGVPLTTLRAGLILGGGGSSFDILVKLVRRLPAMVCPRWTLTRMQPVAVADVIAELAFAVGNRDCFGQTFDVGAPEAMTYRELLSLAAEMLGLKRPMVPVRFFTPRLSRLWVSLVTGAPRELIDPLIESLRHEMVARDLRLAKMAGLEPTPVRAALAQALAEKGGAQKPPASKRARPPPLVRSVQRMRLPAGRDAAFAAAEYVRWLPRALRSLVRAEVLEKVTVRFYVPLLRRPLLELTYATHNQPDRQLFFVTGGLLSRSDQHGRFELRQVLEGDTMLTAIHDFAPRLPWVLYRATQARFHQWVMIAFRKHLARIALEDGRVSAPITTPERK